MGLMVVDLSEPEKPRTIGYVEFLGTAALRVDDECADASAYSKGVCMFGISNPADPVALAAFLTGGEVYGVFITDGFGYVANGGGGLEVIRVVHMP